MQINNNSSKRTENTSHGFVQDVLVGHCCGKSLIRRFDDWQIIKPVIICPWISSVVKRNKFFYKTERTNLKY
jgi:hypothetical protein